MKLRNDRWRVRAVMGVCLLVGACAGSTPPPTRWTEPITGMPFVRIRPGRFTMGSPAGEPAREAQEVRHEVTLSQGFLLGLYEVTQREWVAVMGANPSRFQHEGDRLPVENVSWFETQAFLDRLNQRSPGGGFRLPTEAEWEYACRSGMDDAYATGATIDSSQANVARSAAEAEKGQTMRVGSFPANRWGLFDMHGNVWEWTADEHCPYTSAAVVDPVGRCGAPLKVIRGGSWYFGADSARCALRYTHRPQDRGFSLGFRVAKSGN